MAWLVAIRLAHAFKVSDDVVKQEPGLRCSATRLARTLLFCGRHQAALCKPQELFASSDVTGGLPQSNGNSDCNVLGGRGVTSACALEGRVHMTMIWVWPRPSNSSKIGFRLNTQAKKSTKKHDSGMLRTRPRDTYPAHPSAALTPPTLSPQQPGLLLLLPILLLLPTCNFEKNKHITSLVE